MAARLAVPPRTVRHRLRRLRQAGIVVTGADGLHRLAGATTALPGGHWAVLAVLAAAAIGLAAEVMIRQRPPGQPPPPVLGPGGWGPWTAW